jgi:hypothetical protein
LKNPFASITIGSAVAGFVGYMAAHFDYAHAGPLAAGAMTFATYLVGAIFHRTPQSPQ